MKASFGYPALVVAVLLVVRIVPLLFLLFRPAVFSVTKPESTSYGVSAPALLTSSPKFIPHYSSSPKACFCQASKSTETLLYDDSVSHGSGTMGMCLEIGSYETNQYNAMKKITAMISSAHIIPHHPLGRKSRQQLRPSSIPHVEI